MSERDSTPEPPIAHPHNLVGAIPNRLSSEVIRSLSILVPHKFIFQILLEWLGISCAIAIHLVSENPLVYVVVVLFIGARQNALAILAHDATHMRFLKNKKLADRIANLLLCWPIFLNYEGFRIFHGLHHQFLNNKKDGNRWIWNTHSQEGQKKLEWIYPKTGLQLILKLLRHSCFLAGIRWIIRGIYTIFGSGRNFATKLMAAGFYLGIATAITLFGFWTEFLLLWIVPLCTWHVTIQYIRLIAEHSNVTSPNPAYKDTRTTIPTFIEKILILPCNVGFHIEHHW